jgi:hypothetical protein
VLVREGLGGALHFIQRVGGVQAQRAIGGPAFAAVHAGHGQAQRRQECVQLFHGAARDDRHRAAQVGVQVAQRCHQRGGHDHIFRLLRQIDQRAVKVQEQGAGGAKQVGNIHRSYLTSLDGHHKGAGAFAGCRSTPTAARDQVAYSPSSEAKPLISRGLPNGSQKNIVHCSPGSPG